MLFDHKCGWGLIFLEKCLFRRSHRDIKVKKTATDMDVTVRLQKVGQSVPP